MTKERGVSVTPPLEKAHWHGKGGEVTTYRLRELTPAQIEQYGLTSYLAVDADDGADK